MGLDDPTLSLKQMFQNIAVEFNNKEIIVNLPAGAYNMDGKVDIYPNDYSKIQITWDCKSEHYDSINYIHVLLT